MLRVLGHGRLASEDRMRSPLLLSLPQRGLCGMQEKTLAPCLSSVPRSHRQNLLRPSSNVQERVRREASCQQDYAPVEVQWSRRSLVVVRQCHQRRIGRVLSAILGIWYSHLFWKFFFFFFGFSPIPRFIFELNLEFERILRPLGPPKDGPFSIRVGSDKYVIDFAVMHQVHEHDSSRKRYAWGICLL